MSVSHPTIDERFQAFHAANPDILERLIKLARGAKERGFKEYSIKGLWEVLRFNSNPKTSEHYKLCNNFTSRYARVVMAHAPDLEGFFVLRELKPAPKPDEDDPPLSFYLSDFIH